VALPSPAVARDAVPMRARLDAVPGATPIAAGIGVRTLKPGDAPALGALMHVAYRGTIDDRRESLADQIAEARRTMAGAYGPMEWDASLVATRASALVSACVVTEDRGRLLLAFALTRPEERGHGLAAALITRSAARLRSAGATEWTLAVTRGNPARALYERLGFFEDQSLRSR
jgi:GNAT superfamily N-acetyltransferase